MWHCFCQLRQFSKSPPPPLYMFFFFYLRSVYTLSSSLVTKKNWTGLDWTGLDWGMGDRLGTPGAVGF
jgi:hypothetical protein